MLSKKFLSTFLQNVTWQTKRKVGIQLTRFHNIYISGLKKFHKESIDNIIQ